MKKSLYLIVGILIGATVFGGASAHAAGFLAERSIHRILVDGQETHMTAYTIDGNNYVRLRDIGKAVGFEVYWDSENGCVQVRSDSPYTGEEPAKVEVIKPVPQPESTAPADDADVDAMKQDIVDRTNALRKKNGIAVLTADDKLMQAAQVRAEEMASATVYSHIRPDGRKFNTVTDCPYMAENIHRITNWELSEFSLPDYAVAAWNSSEVHRKNIQNARLAQTGVGLARGVNDNGDSCWYCVQLFLYGGYSIHKVDKPVAKSE